MNHIANPSMVTTTEALQAEWSRVRGLIVAAIPCLGGTHNESDLIAGVLNGSFRLWTSHRSFVLTTIETFPRMKRLHVFLVNGDPKEIARLIAMACVSALHDGAAQVRTSVRPAIERYLQRNPDERAAQGWIRGATTYVKGI